MAPNMMMISSTIKRELDANSAEDDAHSAEELNARKEALVVAKAEEEAKAAREYKAAGPLGKAYLCGMEWLHSTSVQTLLYFIFVIIFQQLAGTIRMPQEFYFNKHVMDRLIDNHFDSSHNTFESVRRVADIYEWCVATRQTPKARQCCYLPRATVLLFVRATRDRAHLTLTALHPMRAQGQQRADPRPHVRHGPVRRADGAARRLLRQDV
jgi:hypothetical protein